MRMNKRNSRLFASVVALVLLVPGSARAQEEIRSERVRFDRGANSAVVEASIQGYEIVDYVLGASAGQYMNVSMATDNTGSYFNILAPGETEVAMYIGSTDGNQYEGTLPADGDYRVRVYLMRAGARRNEVANYRLEMIISGSGGSQAAGDAKVEGTDYHATGMVPCSMGGGEPKGSCAFGVQREGDGNGMVTVTKPDGRTRTIFFENGEATGYDFSQADPGEFSASRKSDLSIVRIGSEVYEIPDAVIFGG
jgi:hypothetical protein